MSTLKTIQALEPLSELAAKHPAVKDPLVDLGHALMCEYVTQTPRPELVCYCIDRVEEISSDNKLAASVRDAVWAFRVRTRCFEGQTTARTVIRIFG